MEPIRITLEQDLKVEYAIPGWLKDEQVKHSTSTVKARVGAVSELRNEPIAVVGYGPSLAETWEQIRGFKYIISCSGAHRFLIERGLVPNWHVAVDPLAGNTVKLIGQPHPEVEYLIASTCHPDVFEHLKDYNLKLWHIFDSEADAFRLLPPEEWALFGGADAGLRSIVMARFLGFTDVHIFGIDGSFGPTGRHAGEHPSPQKPVYLLDYDGQTYQTTPAMTTCARQIPHELDSLPDVIATFHGTGLAQAIWKNYKPNKRYGVQVGICKPALASAEYVRLNEDLHRSNLYYGVGGAKHADTVIKLVAELAKYQPTLPVSVLDYGCGKSLLAKALPFPIAEYDPAIAGKRESPRPADLVVCTDVLEHIEPDRLLMVLKDLQRCVKKQGYFVIHTGPSQKTLADGRNSHLIQEDRRWWKAKLRKYFNVPSEAVIEKAPLLYIVVEPKRAAPVPELVPALDCVEIV